MSAPASATIGAVSILMPPSTWSSTSRSSLARYVRASRIFGTTSERKAAREARLHRHHEEQVHFREEGDRTAERRRGIQDQAGLHARVPDRADRRPDVVIALHVDREIVDPRLREGRHEMLRVGDHQMRIEGDLRQGPDRRDDGGPHREVRHEVPVHHVDVEQVGARVRGFLHLFAEPVEPRGQDRRRDLNGH